VTDICGVVGDIKEFLIWRGENRDQCEGVNNVIKPQLEVVLDSAIADPPSMSNC